MYMATARMSVDLFSTNLDDGKRTDLDPFSPTATITGGRDPQTWPVPDYFRHVTPAALN